MKKLGVFLVFTIVLLGGIALIDYKQNHNDFYVYEKDCVHLDSPQVTSANSMDDLMNKFEASPDFKGYELKDYWKL